MKSDSGGQRITTSTPGSGAIAATIATVSALPGSRPPGSAPLCGSRIVASTIARGSRPAATPAHDHDVAAIAPRRSSTDGMLRWLAQKTAASPSSSELPMYQAFVNAIPRRGHAGSTSSVMTTAHPARCSATAIAEPTSPAPITMAAGRTCFASRAIELSLQKNRPPRGGWRPETPRQEPGGDLDPGTLRDEDSRLHFHGVTGAP